MNRIRLHICDINLDSIGNLLSWIQENYSVEFTNKNPDFIIHSCFGHEVLKYDGIRINWLGENLQPDFNISDYAIGFGHMNFGDRYIRIPLYRWYFSEYESLFEPHRTIRSINGADLLNDKSRFCTLVISNNNRGAYFDTFLETLSNYKHIDSGGRRQNNIGGPVVDKKSFIATGKFHIAFENSSTPGYTTEKILHAFTAHTIPIYWGDPLIAKDFNPKAFINCHDFDNLNSLIEYIAYLDNNEDAYISMLEQPCFKNGIEPEWLSKELIISYIKNIFDQPREQAYRRNLYYWGSRYQDEQFCAFHQPHKWAIKLIYRMIMNR